MLVMFRKPSGEAATSNGIFLNKGSSIAASGLSGANVINIQVLVGDSYTNAMDDTGAAITLTATEPQITINAAGNYRGVSVSTADSVVLSCNQGI